MRVQAKILLRPARRLWVTSQNKRESLEWRVYCCVRVRTAHFCVFIVRASGTVTYSVLCIPVKFYLLVNFVRMKKKKFIFTKKDLIKAKDRKWALLVLMHNLWLKSAHEESLVFISLHSTYLKLVSLYLIDSASLKKTLVEYEFEHSNFILNLGVKIPVECEFEHPAHSWVFTPKIWVWTPNSWV